MKRGVALCVAILLATAANEVSRAAGGAIPGARLTAITSKADGRSASLVIEATEPLPYIATRPDPLTLVVDFRNVSVQGAAAPNVKTDAAGPIASVAVESAHSMGVPVSRVRISLAQPVAHHVRADRQRVVIDFDRPAIGIHGVGIAADADEDVRRHVHEVPRAGHEPAEPFCG